LKNGKAPPNQKQADLGSSKWDNDKIDPKDPDTWPDGKPDDVGGGRPHEAGIKFHDIDDREKCEPPPGEDPSPCPPSKDPRDPHPSKELAVVSKGNDSFSSFDELIASDLDSCPWYTAIGCGLGIVGVAASCNPAALATVALVGVCIASIAGMGLGCYDCVDDALVSIMCTAADAAQTLGAEYPDWLVSKCRSELVSLDFCVIYL
jgi:hypothetical protein